MNNVADWIFAAIAYGAIVLLLAVAVGRHLKRLTGSYRRDRRDRP